MYGKFVRLLYDMQMLVQGLFCLASPIGLSVLGAWLLVTYASVGTWIYALLVVSGTFIGLYSMISFILKVSRQSAALERAAEEKEKQRRRARRLSQTSAKEAKDLSDTTDTSTP